MKRLLIIGVLLPMLFLVISSPVSAQVEVWADGGVAAAGSLGYNPGVILKGLVIMGGNEGPVVQASIWWDGSSKKSVNEGWSLNQRTTFSLLSKTGIGPMVGVGLRRFGGPWTKDYVWWLVGIEYRSEAINLTANYRGEVWASYNNHEKIIEGEARVLAKRFSIGVKVEMIRFFDNWPYTPSRWGVASEFLVGYRLK